MPGHKFAKPLETVVNGGFGERHVDETTGGALAKLFGFVREGNLDDAGDVSGRSLYPDGVSCD